MVTGEYCQKSCNRCPEAISTTIEESTATIIENGEGGVCGCTCDEDKFRALIREVMMEVMAEVLN